MGTDMTKVHYQLLLLMPSVKNCVVWWWDEQKAADTERSARREWQPRFQNYDVACNIQQFWLSRDALAPYKSPQSIYLAIPLSLYSILFYWAEEEESSLSRISLDNTALKSKLSFSPLNGKDPWGESSLQTRLLTFT